MSQVAEKSAESQVMDPYDIGWYLESADEEIYGPASRKTVRRFLEEKTISPNTLVRHCTQPAARPVADQPLIMQDLVLDDDESTIGDKLSQVWPRSKKDRRSLAVDGAPCSRHKKKAMLMCLRCRAPYCEKCRARPYKKQFFMCRKCQAALLNRRFFALWVDCFIFIYLPLIVVGLILGIMGAGEKTMILLQILQILGLIALFFRDSMFRGASPGKRWFGLRVVQSNDGETPIKHRQGLIRWLSQMIPVFNLFDASVPYTDPLIRRFGDRWAGTRVRDTERKLANVRLKTERRMLKRGIRSNPQAEFGMSMTDFARLT